MGLGENSLTNSSPRLVADTGLLVSTLTLDDSLFLESAALLGALDADYQKLLKLEKYGSLKLTEENKKELAEISKRRAMYEAAIKNGSIDISKLNDFIQSDQTKIKAFLNNYQKEISLQEDLFQSATGLNEAEANDALNAWRNNGASSELMQSRIEEEQRETLDLAETNPDLAVNRLNTMTEASRNLNLEELSYITWESKENRISEYEEQLQNIRDNTQKTVSEHKAELEALKEIPESELDAKQLERKKDLEEAIQYYNKLMKREGWEEKIYDSLSEQEKQKLAANPDSDEALQIVNRAIADSDETGTVMRGFYALSDGRFSKLLGANKQDFYNQYQSKYSLDSVLSKEMIKDLRAGTYSDYSYYSNNESSSSENSNDAGEVSGETLEARISNLIADLESRGEIIAAEQNHSNREIAAKLGLGEDHPIVIALVDGDYSLAKKLADGTSIESTINNEDNNLLLWTENVESFKFRSDKSINEYFLGLSFA